jgi:Icc-related predicted phosphoesterase
MKILHLTDLHNNIWNLGTILHSENPDLVVLSGDLTHFGNSLDMQTIINSIKLEISVPLLAVSGNCDNPETIETLKALNVSIENKIFEYQNFNFIGLGGSLPCPGKTPNEYSEDDFNEKIQYIESKLGSDKPIILVCHQPPFKTKNDRIINGIHVGSKIIRRFIENYQPIICLTGHIHEGKGIDSIGKCQIINPGPYKNGHYATIEFTGEQSPVISLL